VVRHSRRGGLWAGLILSALVLLLLLVFILQNGNPVQISFFALEGVLPVGVALLLAAIAGVLLVAIPGSLRIMQLRRAPCRGSTGRDDGAVGAVSAGTAPGARHRLQSIPVDECRTESNAIRRAADWDSARPGGMWTSDPAPNPCSVAVEVLAESAGEVFLLGEDDQPCRGPHAQRGDEQRPPRTGP
jgi:uncharacterized integral membrane protein